LVNPAYALAAALIWAFSPIYYRVFLEKFDFLSFNVLRTVSASAALLIPALYYWSSAGSGYAILSGVITLTLGDSLFLLAIRENGASVSTPVVYTYVLMIQLLGALLGQAVPSTNFVAAAMVVGGVYVLSRGGEGKPRVRGMVLAISAGVMWTVGQELVQFSTAAGGNFVVIAFLRNASGAAALGAAFLMARKRRKWPSGLPLREYAFMVLIAVSDLALGSSLFVYSISALGVALTVILTSLSPLLTQVFARALGKESPSTRDFAGGVLIVAALILAVAF
jgi:drug/metabolite transporter, DME family